MEIDEQLMTDPRNTQGENTPSTSKREDIPNPKQTVGFPNDEGQTTQLSENNQVVDRQEKQRENPAISSENRNETPSQGYSREVAERQSHTSYNLRRKPEKLRKEDYIYPDNQLSSDEEIVRQEIKEKRRFFKKNRKDKKVCSFTYCYL